MGQPTTLTEICRAMTDATFYPHPVSRIERRDTHISAVFLTGEWVYKLKKPVDFGFLNFTELADRGHFCREEVRLNQRLSRGIYQGVEEIRRDPAGRLTLNGPGEVVEYAVKMRQLPEASNLQSLLAEGEIGPRQLRRLGSHLASFYARSGRGSEIDHYGEAEVIAYNMEENFRQLDPFVGKLVPAEKWEFIRQVSRAFFGNWQQLFDHRLKTGRIRDGHGDLRTDHIYFHEGIQIIDCIEFNERFRYGDVINDLAFLHMDMEHLGHAQASRTILAAYVEQADDPELYTLIDFYAAYRAVVKLKVACLQAAEEGGDQPRLHRQAADYLAHAYRYALQFSRPTLWVVCGLPASGKSTVAEQVARDLSAVLLQSDRIRKEGNGCPALCPGVTAYGEGLYRPELRQRVYARMLAAAQEQLRHGRCVVLDASFSRRKWRDEVRQLAKDLDTNLIFAECTCREATMRKRLKLRDDRAELSDARLPHLHNMIRDFELVSELPAAQHLKLDTDQPFPTVLDDALAMGYARKCRQVVELIDKTA